MNKIISLRDFTDEQINKLEREKLSSPLYEKPSKSYDNYGLRYSVEHLNKIGQSLIFLPIEYMAEYVDVVTKTNVDIGDPDFLEQILNINPKNIDTSDKNATSIGNAAYVALNSKDEKARKIAFGILERILQDNQAKFI